MCYACVKKVGISAEIVQRERQNVWNQNVVAKRKLSANRLISPLSAPNTDEDGGTSVVKNRSELAKYVKFNKHCWFASFILRIACSLFLQDKSTACAVFFL